jgi:hypothetical protein
VGTVLSGVREMVSVGIRRDHRMDGGRMGKD